MLVCVVLRACIFIHCIFMSGQPTAKARRHTAPPRLITTSTPKPGDQPGGVTRPASKRWRRRATPGAGQEQSSPPQGSPSPEATLDSVDKLDQPLDEIIEREKQAAKEARLIREAAQEASSAAASASASATAVQPVATASAAASGVWVANPPPAPLAATGAPASAVPRPKRVRKKPRAGKATQAARRGYQQALTNPNYKAVNPPKAGAFKHPSKAGVPVTQPKAGTSSSSSSAAPPAQPPINLAPIPEGPGDQPDSDPADHGRQSPATPQGSEEGKQEEEIKEEKEEDVGDQSLNLDQDIEPEKSEEPAGDKEPQEGDKPDQDIAPEDEPTGLEPSPGEEVKSEGGISHHSGTEGDQRGEPAEHHQRRPATPEPEPDWSDPEGKASEEPELSNEPTQEVAGTAPQEPAPQEAARGSAEPPPAPKRAAQPKRVLPKRKLPPQFYTVTHSPSLSPSESEHSVPVEDLREFPYVDDLDQWYAGTTGPQAPPQRVVFLAGKRRRRRTRSQEVEGAPIASPKRPRPSSVQARGRPAVAIAASSARVGALPKFRPSTPSSRASTPRAKPPPRPLSLSDPFPEDFQRAIAEARAKGISVPPGCFWDEGDQQGDPAGAVDQRHPATSLPWHIDRWIESGRDPADFPTFEAEFLHIAQKERLR